MILWAALSLLVLGDVVFAKLSCKDDQGQDVDWEIFYKLPRLPKSTHPTIRVGEGYAYLEVADGAKQGTAGKWILSDQSVEDDTSLFGRTYSQLLDKRSKLAYIIYNDQQPDKNSSSTHWGHVKGMVVTDGVTGFWLVHSIPKYPINPSEGEYDYPDNAKENGQSGICISFKFETLPQITSLLRYSRPNIFAKKTIPVVDKMPAEISQFFRGKVPVIKQAPWNITTTVESSGGETFVAFAKHTKWAQDLYDDAVAPNLRTSLYAETWRTGAGGKMPPDCTDKYTVYNVEVIDLDFKGPDSVSFRRTDDHSKWAIGQEGRLPWVCVGDVNRMDSQKKRGGGAVCVKSAPVWRAYKNAVSQFEGCSVQKN